MAMVSRHADGEMVSRLIACMGYRTVRGSSTRGGSAATRQMVVAIRKGAVAAMICDGPRGPAMQMKIGTPWIATMAGARVVPITWAGSRVWRFGSWDRFQVPKPFSRVVIVLDDPLPPVRKETAAIEEFRVLLEQRMNELVDRAEKQVKEETK